MAEKVCTVAQQQEIAAPRIEGPVFQPGTVGSMGERPAVDEAPAPESFLSRLMTDSWGVGGVAENRDDHVVQSPSLLFQSHTNEESGVRDGVSAKTDGKSLGGGATFGHRNDESLASVDAAMRVDRDRVSGGISGQSWTGDKRKGEGSGTSWGLSANSDGRFDAQVGMGVGKQAVVAGAGVDLDASGQVQEVHASLGLNRTKGSVTIEPSSIGVEGCTVSWSVGGGAVLGVGTKQGSGGAHVAGKRVQTRRFVSPEEAEAFAASLHHTPQDNRRMDFSAMEPGTAASFFVSQSMGGKGQLGVLGSNAGKQGSSQFTVVRKGEKLEVVMIDTTQMMMGAGAAAGMLGSSGGWESGTRRDVQLQVDLDAPEALAALQDLVQGGSITPELLATAGLQVGYKSVDQTCVTGAMDLGVAQLAERHCTGSGQYADPELGEQGGVEVGGSQNNERRHFEWLYTMLGSNAPDRAGDYEDKIEVYQPMSIASEQDGMHLVTKQRFDFKQREVCRRLHDQVDPLRDRDEVSDALLPASDEPGMDEMRSWMLESEVNAEGTERIVDALRSGDSDLEWEALRNLPWIRRELKQGMSPEQAITELAAYGGEDTAEGLRNLAGEENVERYLYSKGSNVWIGRAANKKLDSVVADLVERHRQGDEGAAEPLWELVAVENNRFDALGASERGIPAALVEEERTRADERAGRILDAFAGVVCTPDLDCGVSR